MIRSSKTLMGPSLLTLTNKQTSFTSSGGTVTLEGKLTKLLILNDPFTMTLTCDKNGNISAT